MAHILRITQNTIFKLRPEPASELSAEEVNPVAAEHTYEIHSYAYGDVNGPFNGHIKVALKDTSIRGLNTWFINSADAQVEADGEVVYPTEDQESYPILQINQSTVLKRRPVDAVLLPESEKFAIARGRSFQLHSYAYADAQGDFDAHIKFAIRDREDFIRGFSTWFVYEQHAYVAFDGEGVYPPEDPDIPVLQVTQDTVFKRRPLSSYSLPADELASVPQGTMLKLAAYATADARGSLNGHIRITLRYARDDIRGINTWYVFTGHAQVLRDGKVVYPAPGSSPTPRPTPRYEGRSFKLPGNVSTFYTDQPIVPGGTFTWGEATKNATRIPDRVEIVNNIVALARVLQRARNQLGRSFIVNSWYRPPAVNRAVGGVRNSQHLTGKAVDLRVPGLSGRRVANAVMLWWPGGVGIYSNLPDIVHLDIGPKRTWGV